MLGVPGVIKTDCGFVVETFKATSAAALTS